MSSQVDEQFFGGTRLCLIHGKPLDHLHAGLYTGANARGVMGAGLPADIRRLAGADVERELRAQSPLLLGSAYLTSAGDLTAQGVKAIAHGVVLTEPGGTSTLDMSIKALLAGLLKLEEAGCRAVTIPQIGWRVTNVDQAVAAAELARVTITHLRRRSKLDTVAIVSQHRDYLDVLSGALRTQIRGALSGDGRAAE